MATAPMKSQPLHNFSLSFLKWGTNTAATAHRSRIHALTDTSEPDNDSDHESTRPLRLGSRSSRAHRLSFPSSSSSSAAAAAKQQKDATERPHKQTTTALEKEAAAVEKNETGEEEDRGEEETAAKPWNLRPRKAAKNADAREALVDSTGVMDGHYEKQKPKSMRLREMVESRGNNHVEKKEKNKFWLALSRDEIEEDVFIMTGSRPARRPRKRPKNVQKQLDAVFPGLWLVGATVDAYRVTDSPMKK
ncbi:hypothetical protein ACOSP7_025477 [Xanthoceras sorbifolium]